MKSKTSKFLIICAIVFCVGSIIAIVGFFTGGILGINKAADKYDWLETSPGEPTMASWSSPDIKALKVVGEMDVCILNADKLQEGLDYIDENIGGGVGVALQEETPEVGKVYVVYGENVVAPEFVEDNGVLTIKGNWQREEGVVHVNLLNGKELASWIPTVVMVCNEDMLPLADVKITNDNCDTYIDGVSFENCEINTDYADINLMDVRSSGLKITGDDSNIEIKGMLNGITDISGNYTDVEFTGVTSEELKIVGDDRSVKLRGTLNGTTDIRGNYSDVEISTSLDKSEYGFKLYTVDGDISLDGLDVESDDNIEDFLEEGGPNQMIIRGDCGDIKLLFNKLVY